MIPVSERAARIEYAIRDVVVPATELEAQGHEIIKLNIGDPIIPPKLDLFVVPGTVRFVFQQTFIPRDSMRPETDKPFIQCVVICHDHPAFTGR